MRIQSATYITTKNDVNGNPRRAFIVNEINTEDVIPHQHIIDVLDIGYEGYNILRKTYPNCLESSYKIEVSPKEYKSFLKMGKEMRNGRSNAQ